LERELKLRGIVFERKPGIEIPYKGEPLDKRYFPDLLVAGGVIAELKTVQALVGEHEAQLLNYLRATKKRVGYLINFGSKTKLEWKRMVL
jgi:GxxExxY protein